MPADDAPADDAAAAGEVELGPKASRTRSAIIDAALRLFREHGFEATTMRAIATEAGVSVGNAYYYFASKEHLIQAFYDRTQADHARSAQRVLDRETDLEARMIGVVEAWVEVMEPYRAFAGTFFKNAAEPTSPLSPFSPESTPARETSIDLWRQVVQGSDARIPKVLRAELPELLWLYFMGVVLYWVHDPTPGAARTRLLAGRTVPMVVRTIGLARLPVLRSTLADLLALIQDLKGISA
ncbi:MAG TPA: TetR family transcriptional regulator [Acidimicrobiales bacterium]|nr:TetR family transcriptional regulator [Acidimicrobiales bacterium]